MASSRDIEREVETQRANVENTLDALKQKMSFGKVMDEFSGYFGGEDAKHALHTASRQIRDNPIAFGLVSVGVAWMMLGSGRSRDDSGSGYRTVAQGGGSYSGVGRSNPGAAGGASYGSAYGSPYQSQSSGSSEGVLSKASSAIGGAAQTVGDTISGVKDTIAGVADTVTHGVAGAAGTLRSAADTVRGAAGSVRGAGQAGASRLTDAGAAISARMPDPRRVADQGRRTVGVLADAMERQPLMVGAFAVAAGVAVGAALPATRTEDRLMGGERDDLIDNARDAVGAMGRQAADAAKAGLRAATDTAQGEGLALDPQGKTIAAKLEAAVMAGVDETRRRLDPDQLSAEPDENSPNRL